MSQAVPKREIPKAYDHNAVEQRIYDFWEKEGYFIPKIDHSVPSFTIIMPPPNVTGKLHYGHALTTALEDLITRWHRMKGESTLYLPGTDHAGIATQVVVERALAKDNVSRHDMGRQKFTEEVWKWVNQYGGTINNQLRRLGASCDWTRSRFTLDKGPSKAVRTTFVNLYKKGLIYRGERIVNWCPRCSTALSDLEVTHREENAGLYYIRYLLENEHSSITVATTRPETLLGDTAIAVNPIDNRYKKLIGKNAVLPILNRIIPIIGDEAVDPDFGTGALKVTPGHDPADFGIGERHNLPIINIMNLDGTLNENSLYYNGQNRFNAREKIVKNLEGNGLLLKVEHYHHSVGHCDRCDEIAEPMVIKQWWMKMEPLSKPAIEAVETGAIKILPERFEKVYYNWMRNIQDWCISRQLWWGHQIPVWYCEDCNGITVEHEDPTICGECSSNKLVRDPDVLDTWFSSALWPHSTLGWPDQTEDMEYFYPTVDLETGHDILFFWVARMIMMGLENTGKIPFHTVYLHGLVRDPDGVKMSKSKGNVMDPLELVDLYGSDAVRFALTTRTSPGNDMRLTESKMEASRNFANKLWNASRYVINSLEHVDDMDKWNWPPQPNHLEDRWIMSRFNRVADEVERHMKGYQFGEAQREIHDFLWGEYCDWYLEMSKVRLGSEGESPLPILSYILEKILRLLHPFMPFITEEIWHTLLNYLPNYHGNIPSLMVSTYPKAKVELFDKDAESDIEAIMEIVHSVRNIRAEFRIQPSKKIKVVVDAPAIKNLVQSEAETIRSLAKADTLQITSADSGNYKSDTGHQVSVVLTQGTVTVPLEGLVDLGAEIKRLSNELNQIQANRKNISVRLDNPTFLEKAPEDVIERERQRLYIMNDRKARIEETLSRIKSAT